MGKKKKYMNLQCIMECMVAKRLYVALIPIDNLLHDLHEEIEEGSRSVKDPFFVKGLRLRKRMVRLLKRAVKEARC